MVTSHSGKIRGTYNAMVNSGAIRYEGLPAAAVAVADAGGWVELFIAANAPQTDYWVCGFNYGITPVLVVDVSLLICIGWGGADGAAVVPPNVIVAHWPICITAGVAALGPAALGIELLPYPVKVPAAQRMAVEIDSSPIGTTAFTDFNVIVATLVGRGN